MPGSKVLIVDDDPELVALISSWLKREGMETCFAADGASCLMQARKQQPDLIVLDLGLPAGDGMTALARLKKNVNTSQVPVVVLSARSADTSSRAALDAGAHAYLEKTGTREQFLETVRGVLSEENIADSFA